MSWDQIVADAREAKERRQAADKALAALSAEKRVEFVRDAAFHLPLEQQRQLVADLIVRVEGAEPPRPPDPPKQEAKVPPAEPKVAPPPPPNPPKPNGGGSYVDKAEAYVLAHPEGVETPEVGKAIGQKTANADGSLRQVMNNRKTIERRDDKWFPKVSADAAEPPARNTIRTKIINVFLAMKKPLDSTDIWEAAKRLDPNINRGSFEGEMNRLRRDKLIVAIEGKQGKHGSGVYVLANGGTHATA